MFVALLGNNAEIKTLEETLAQDGEKKIDKFQVGKSVLNKFILSYEPIRKIIGGKCRVLQTRG